MILLYGSYARGDYIDECHVLEDGMTSEYRSDVDVLVVIHGKNTNATGRQMPGVLLKLQDQEVLSAPLHCIYESAVRFNSALGRGEYFYQDVITEGMVLYDDNFELTAPQIITPAIRRELSSEYFERFFGKASQFHRIFEYAYQRKLLPEAIYNLHQMTENLFAAYLATITLYKPRTHKLYQLRFAVKKLDRHIRQIFPTTEVQDGKDFGFFSAAYVDSRYKANYVVDPEVMDKLTGWVEAFQHWVYKECLKAIDEFVPEENFSNGYKLHFPLMDFEDLKVRPLVEDLLIKEKIEKDQALREKELERLAKEQALEEKDQALEREAKALKENEALRRKLKEAGLDDDGK